MYVCAHVYKEYMLMQISVDALTPKCSHQHTRTKTHIGRDMQAAHKVTCVKTLTKTDPALPSDSTPEP